MIRWRVLKSSSSTHDSKLNIHLSSRCKKWKLSPTTSARKSPQSAGSHIVWMRVIRETVLTVGGRSPHVELWCNPSISRVRRQYLLDFCPTADTGWFVRLWFVSSGRHQKRRDCIGKMVHAGCTLTDGLEWPTCRRRAAAVRRLIPPSVYRCVHT